MLPAALGAPPPETLDAGRAKGFTHPQPGWTEGRWKARFSVATFPVGTGGGCVPRTLSSPEVLAFQLYESPGVAVPGASLRKDLVSQRPSPTCESVHTQGTHHGLPEYRSALELSTAAVPGLDSYPKRVEDPSPPHPRILS